MSWLKRLFRAPPKCHRSVMFAPNLYVETWSDSGSASICSVSASVRHKIRIKNLGGYPANVYCKGLIQQVPAKVKFQSDGSQDTATCWLGYHPDLQDREVCEFAPALLVPDPIGGPGEQLIEAEVKIAWPQPGRQRREVVSILVDA
ncbi:MAG TPA: hypothetical protein VF092_04845 [Longimicrobium sp.]